MKDVERDCMEVFIFYQNCMEMICMFIGGKHFLHVERGSTETGEKISEYLLAVAQTTINKIKKLDNVN